MKTNWWKAIASFLVVLLTMPLGHALMMIMEKTMTPAALHYSAFFMGFAGLVIVIAGVFVKGDTKQTFFGLIGGLLFWTGWVEFLFQYYATRWGTLPEMENGEVVTRPEYLILPASFGMWMMMMTLYIFSTRNGCNFINWCQRVLLGSQERDSSPSNDPSHQHRHVHGAEHDTMGKLSASYVLLRQELPWRPPSCHQHHSCRLSAWQRIHLQEAASAVVVGCQHPHGYSNGRGVLGAGRSARTTRLLP